MSETTLDQIRHWRDRAVQGVVTPLTTVQIIRLCDAAEHAETLQAQLTEVTRERDELRQVSETAISGWKARSAKAEAALKMEQNAHDVCSHGQQIIIDKLNQESQRAESAEAALAPLRAVVEAAKAWREVWLAYAGGCGCDTCNARNNRVHQGLLDALEALPADPSAPMPKE